MSDSVSLPAGLRFLIGVAGFVIVVAGMKAAASILVPFLVAVFLAVIAAPLVFWLKNRKVPTAVAVLISVVAMMAILSSIGVIVGSSLNSFVNALPSYQVQLQGKIQLLLDWLAGHGIRVSDETVLEYFNPGAAMGMVARLLNALGGLVTNTFLIFLTVIFILLEASGFSTKLKAAMQNPDATLGRFELFADKVKRYGAIKTFLSLGTGTTVAIFLTICGVDFPLLWGLLAFLLNYIPNLGSIFAAIPAILLAGVQHGLGMTIIVAGGYLVINVFFSNLLEPRVMGRGLGLSTLVVFLSLIVWAWILGPVGMLLSVPLTITLKIAFESSEKTRWIGVLLGPEIALESQPSPESEEETKG
jgi:predicted PurR-regulated permease PerM